MNRKELVAAMAKQSGVNKTQTEKVLKAFMDVVSEELAKGGSVPLIGFGTFHVTERQEREGRNPATGETILIPSSKCPKFKAGNTLKEKVQGN